MPENERIKLSGKSRWAWVQEFKPSKFGKWTIDLNLDDKSLSTVLDLKKQGVKNVLKKDDDGYWITLSRPVSVKIKGVPTVFTPVRVLEADGKTEYRGAGIGNGSDVTCKIEIRKYTVPVTKEKGVALRLETVRIDNLVPYTDESTVKADKDMDKPYEEDF